MVHDRDCVVEVWCMGWLGEDQVRQEARRTTEWETAQQRCCFWKNQWDHEEDWEDGSLPDGP